MAIRPRDLSRALSRVLVAASMAAASGCGVNFDDGGSQVWGRVTVRGAPVTQGAVVLMPLDDRAHTWGAGNLDDYGRFRVKCSRPDVPLDPGTYAVYIRPIRHLDQETEKPVPPKDFPVAEKYMDEENPVIRVRIKDEPTMLDLKLDD